ncbi:MAG: putative GntR family transcriptional regulator [Acidimicrobiaceae bacterium]|jgi:GntR family transcriptional repressor for pyruvate dehydrogenase complex|nr:putative GntR family transcriptional regulator [Acidimicrobiaceae bacterium]
MAPSGASVTDGRTSAVDRASRAAQVHGLAMRLAGEPISRRTVSEEVRERLSGAIRAGLLRPGECLPSERSLCEELGVARTSVREAIHGLLVTGAVERRGNRTFVAERLPELDLASSRDSVALRELFEVRRLIEVLIAELAAERATPEEQREIGAVARCFRARMPIASFRERNVEFHAAIARAAHNSLLAELFGKVSDALAASYDWPSDGSAAAFRMTTRSGNEHRAMAKAVGAGDGALAVALAEGHLYELEQANLERSSCSS